MRLACSRRRIFLQGRLQVLPGGLDRVRLRDDLLRKVLGEFEGYEEGFLRIIKWLRRTGKLIFFYYYY